MTAVIITPEQKDLLFNRMCVEIQFWDALTLLVLLDPEDRSPKFLQNVSNYTPNDTLSHPQGLESSAVLL
jgi:hypothetical protein